jgi:hypothetical protein
MALRRQRPCAGPSTRSLSGGAAPIVAEALARIAELYAIEAEIRGRSADERRAVRQEKTRPLIDGLKTWLEAQRRLAEERIATLPLARELADLEFTGTPINEALVRELAASTFLAN